MAPCLQIALILDDNITAWGMQEAFCCDFNTESSTPDLLMGQVEQNNVIFNNITHCCLSSKLHNLLSSVSLLKLLHHAPD